MPDTRYPAPPFDVELAAVLTVLADQVPSTLPREALDFMRSIKHPTPPIEQLLGGRAITHEERVVPGPAGEPDITLSIFTRIDHTPGGPGIYNIHGGGMVQGDRFVGVEQVLDWVEEFDAVGVSVEYRLAPENPDPAPVSDCYAGLVYFAEHADELGFDADRILIIGGSAGGGLAAGTTLMARDKGGPKLFAQVIACGMLDDRNETISSHQIDGIGVWDRTSNDTGWFALLGDRLQTDDVSIYAAPGRATDLSGLPQTYMDAGSAEVFRDEVVAYASKIWAAGGICELHIWPGGFHGFDGMAPHAAISRTSVEMRHNWVRRVFGA